MAKPTSSIPPKIVELYDRLVAALPGVERKGVTMPYTSVNGHMFSFLTKEGALVLRLPPGQRDAFIAEHEAQPCVQHGATLQEFVVVPERLLRKPDVLKAILAASHAHFRSLKPKPTTRKKAPATKAKPAVHRG
jgi:hypothetical protein